MTKGKLKPVLPSLREKKRYLVYEVVSDKKIKDFKNVNEAIICASLDFQGISGTARSGILNLENKWNSSLQRGILKTGHKSVDNVKASLNFIKEIEGNEAIVRSIGISGILKKAESKFIKNNN